MPSQSLPLYIRCRWVCRTTTMYIQPNKLRSKLYSFVTIPYKSLWQSENLCKHLKITWKFVFECALFCEWTNDDAGNGAAVDTQTHIEVGALRVMYLSSYSFRFMPILANLFSRGSYATRHTILLFIIWIR